MAKDGIAAIERSMRTSMGREAVNRLARGHLSFRNAVRFNETSNVAAAAQEAEAAAQLFASGGSPYQHWATVFRAVAEYASRRFDSARAALRLDSAADIDADYLYLAGRRKWIAGLILANEGHLLTSLTRYREKCTEMMQSAGEANGEASVARPLAEVLARLGTPGEAWRYQLAALSHTRHLGSNTKSQLFLLETAGVLCTDMNLIEAAMYFQNAVLAYQHRTDAAGCPQTGGGILQLREDRAKNRRPGRREEGS